MRTMASTTSDESTSLISFPAEGVLVTTDSKGRLVARGAKNEITLGLQGRGARMDGTIHKSVVDAVVERAEILIVCSRPFNSSRERDRWPNLCGSIVPNL